jgi:hypothetical protein
VALKIERVVDGGMDAEEALRRPGRLEPLHLALSPAHGLMGILDAIVLSEALLTRAGQPQLPESRSVRSSRASRRIASSAAMSLRSEVFYRRFPVCLF